MIPKESKQYIWLRYVQDIRTVTYVALLEQVFAYCTSNSKGLSGMHLDALHNIDDNDEDFDALRKGTGRVAQATLATTF